MSESYAAARYVLASCSALSGLCLCLLGPTRVPSPRVQDAAVERQIERMAKAGTTSAAFLTTMILAATTIVKLAVSGLPNASSLSGLVSFISPVKCQSSFV